MPLGLLCQAQGLRRLLFLFVQGLSSQTFSLRRIEFAALHFLQKRHGLALVIRSEFLLVVCISPGANRHALYLGQTCHGLLKVLFEIADALLRHLDRVFELVDYGVSLGLGHLKNTCKDGHYSKPPFG